MTPLYFLAALALLLDAPTRVSAACECTGKNTGLDTASIGLPSEWGTGCKAWFDGDCVADESETGHPCGTRVAPWTCDKIWPDVDQHGTWCCDAWCYIDPAECSEPTDTYYPTFQKQTPGTKR